MIRQFTATVYIFHNDRVLLHYHPKHNKWLPPGGHVEANETPPEAARREVQEEAGVQISFITQENLFVDAYNGKSIERPYLCLLENIPARAKEEAHQHIDMIYLANLASEDQLSLVKPEFKWVSKEEIKELGDQLFPDCVQLLNQVMVDQTIYQRR